MAEPTKQVQQARAAYSGRRWAEAHRLLTTADQVTPLQPEDLERLAVVAALLGRDDRSTEVLARLYHLHLGRSDVASAARDASWLALTLIDRGEMARGAGWLGRARTLLADGTPACAADGFVLLPEAYQNLVGGDVAQARDGFDRAAAVGARFNDPDLVTLAGLGGGMARILSGERAEGVSMLDEVMVAVTSDEVSPIIVGIAYCAAIETWRELCDLHRAREWTAALSDWCASQPDLVPYRGQCQVHRSEVLQLRGAWGEAMEEVLQARRRLSAPPGQPAAGMACYQQAELHRLRGQFAEAEEAYRDAGQWGRDVQPGLALLRLAQGRTEEAGAALRRVLAEAPPAASRAEVLAALVDTSLAAGATAAARSASDELAVLAAAFDTPLIDAISALAGGAVDLA
ncbi:MAG: DNA-binding response regulator, partial [Actinomycetota bacterium]|nr:DNA-binding response regulator [Actinomycetota bacterium]